MSAFRTAGSLDDVAVQMGDSGFSRLNMRDEAELLAEGELAVSQNGRLERRSWQPRKAIRSLSGALQQDGDPLLVPFFVVDTPIAIVSAERDAQAVFVEVASHPFAIGESAWLGVSGLTFTTTDPNGQRLVTVVDATSLEFGIEDAPAGLESYGGSGLLANYLDDGEAAAIWGACVFSDPSEENEEWIIEAATGTAYKVKTSDGTVTALPYPANRAFDGRVDLIQAFDRVFIFEDGVRSLELLPGASAFTDVPGGDFTQPQVFAVTGTNVDVVSGLCTVTVVGNTTVAADDMVRIYDSTDPHFEPFAGREFKCVSASTTTIVFYIPVEDLSTISANTLSVGKQVSVGLGFSYLPAPPWGVYHQRRLVVPYRYTQATDGSDPVYTERDVSDELVISDILDPHTFDNSLNQFRITAGVANFLVGAYPLAEDRLLVLMRNSVHQITGMSGALSDCVTTELTAEIGCIARKSIAAAQSNVMFLADDGVRLLQFFDTLTLRPIGEPLSAPIQPVIDRINADLAPFAVGAYFGNRYWLAVPLDSEAGAGDATGNNAILVFNFLNGGWESIDTVGDERWNVLELLISRAGERNDLYAVNTLGGVHKLDADDSDHDDVALTPGEPNTPVPVVSAMQTRQYEAGTQERKRYSRVQLMVEAAGQPCDAAITFSTEDPDSENALSSLSALLGGNLDARESASVRPRVGGYRGQGCKMAVTPLSGRPKIKSVLVEGQISNRATVAQK